MGETHLMDQPTENAPLGSQADEKTTQTSWVWLVLHPLGDLTLAGFGVYLLVRPTLASLMTLMVVAGMRRLFGPKVGVAVMMAVSSMLILILVLLSLSTRSSNGGQLTACKSNLKNIATALEMYSTDNGGLYPHSLEQLTPMYLKSIPSCPSARRNTYSASYQHQDHPDLFTIDCHGLNHTGKGIHSPNYPRFGNVDGLIER